MDNISRVVGVNTSMGETHRQAAYKRMERAKGTEQKDGFGDIYDVRLLSAELNRSSADFRGMMMREAGKELNKVIGSLEQMTRTDELVTSYPSEDIIALTKLAAERGK
ncbi:MAG: hypothetical protein IJD28_04590 [Deferribacterales bacterium]|nr:hypothetical protein [Deferribacterales bacterium]